MQQFVLAIHILVCLVIIVLVLLQHGKGADAGATFGGGQSSNTMFGSQGAVPFLMKMTAICAAMFFSTSLLLTYLPAHTKQQQDLRLPAVQQSTKIPSGLSGLNEHDA